MLYRTLDKVGLVSLKNTLVNASAIVGAIVVVYAISWIWKHLIKPTYYNFKGEPKPPTQASPFTQAKTFTHSPSHSPQIIKEEPARVIEPARSDQTVHQQNDLPELKTNEVEAEKKPGNPTEVRQTKSRKKKSG
jgi:hypothetical protein